MLIISSVSLFAQGNTQKINGVIIDELGEPMIGVTIVAEGYSVGTITDYNGEFTLLPPTGTKNIVISFVGYETQIVPVQSGKMKIKLMPQTQELQNVVVVGYGAVRKSDLTGSVATINADDFNTGLINSPEQLINGKISGVQIMNTSGSPTAGSTIRIRGGASLNASNDPLIVVDGVPLENGGISGNSGNFLSLINPNDIENMTVLKDASSAAIYGSRASNGVIIITTKKGSADKLRVSVSTVNSIQTVGNLPDMLSRNEFENIIRNNGTAEQIALLGTENTDWNKQIYRNAFGTDNNVSLSGKIIENFPFRASVGYYNQDGILKTDNAERYTGSINLSPSFFKNHLTFNVNVKGAINNNHFANNTAIWAASVFNPTVGIYSGNDAYGGYNEALDNTGNPVNAGVRNPLGLLNQYDSKSTVKRIIGNFDMDYKFHFLPELKFHLTIGGDFSRGEGDVYVPIEAASNYTTGGLKYHYGPEKNKNKLLTTYLNYAKYFEEIKSNIEVTAGYDYQKWTSESDSYIQTNIAGETQSTIAAKFEPHTLISFYGRLNYTFDDKYILSATVRGDGTSRFKHKWGTFPSVALGWRVSEEEFMESLDFISNLKLRASYGKTGQQEGIGNFGYLPVYTYSQDGAQYLFGSYYVYTYRPEAYVSDLKWESTTAYNVGFDFGLIENRINGSFEYYTRKTKDLLATVPCAAGTNFNKTILTNVGNVDSHGYEVTLSGTPIQTKGITWDVTFNATYQKMKIKNLSLSKDVQMSNTLVGPSIDSYTFQVLSEGYRPNMFYVYHQLYDVNGKPIEGAYADVNNDGVINDEDRYRYHSPDPDWILGFSTSLRYQKWTLSTSLRANIGNYVYNGMAMNTGAWNTVSYNSSQLNNLNRSYLKTGFTSRQYLSDYYVENASFLKMDNITLNYDFGRIAKNLNLNVSAMVQNVFTVTKYSGTDPEVPNGMDMSFYPRPRTFSLSLGLQF